MKKLKEMRDANSVEVEVGDEVTVNDILDVVTIYVFQISVATYMRG